MAELAREHTHLEAVSCSLLARFGNETFLAVTVFMYIFTTRCLGDLLTYARSGVALFLRETSEKRRARGMK